MVFIYTSAISQVIGVGKVAWVVVQLFAMAGVCLSLSLREPDAAPNVPATSGATASPPDDHPAG
jgi:hypothetical protein